MPLVLIVLAIALTFSPLAALWSLAILCTLFVCLAFGLPWLKDKLWFSMYAKASKKLEEVTKLQKEFFALKAINPNHPEVEEAERKLIVLLKEVIAEINRLASLVKK